MPEITLDIRVATLIVAADDSLHKNMANYVCDGTDDDVEIQAALDALPAGGGEVVLLEGNYSIGAQLSINTDYTIFRCLGTIQNNGAGHVLIVAASHVKVIDGVYDSNNVADKGGIYVNVAAAAKEDILIRDVEVKNADLYGISFGQNTTYLTIQNSFIHDCDGGIIGSGIITGGCSYVTIENNRLETVGIVGGSHGIYVNYTDYLKIRGNAVSGVTDGYGIRAAEDTDYCEITGNTVVGVSAAGSPIIASEGSKHVIIGHNMIYNCGGAYAILITSSPFTVIANEIGTLTKVGAYGIYISGKDDGQIIGNNIGADGAEITGRGIFLFTSGSNYRVSIIGNTIRSIKGNAIDIDAGYERCVIIGNSIDGGLSAYTGIHMDGSYNLIHGNVVRNGDYNLELSASSSNNKVVDNDFRTAGVAPILDDGTNNYLYEQYSDLFMDVLAVAVDYVRNNEDLSAGIPITFTIDAQPDVPRTLSFVLTSGNITEFDLEIVGVNAKGQTVTETFDETGGFAQETNEAYATITSIKLTSRTGTGAGDLGDVGITDVLGLSNVLRATAGIYKIKKNNANALVAGAQVDLTYDTYDMAVIGLGAADDFTIWFRRPFNIIA